MRWENLSTAFGLMRGHPSSFVPIEPLVQNKTNHKMGYLATVNEDGGNCKDIIREP
jgi:hypothetical protein